MYAIYTDGGNRNTGVFKGQHMRKSDLSAYAYLVIDRKNGHRIRGTKGYEGRTNNQMELQGVIAALSRLVSLSNHKPLTDVFNLYSDSRYIVNSITEGRLTKWIATGKIDRHPNSGQWKQVFSLLHDFSHLQFHWVKGHASNRGNIYVDSYLNQTMDHMMTEA